MKTNEAIKMFESAKFKARHGDVILIKSSLELDSDKAENNIIANGEATGHAHRVLGETQIKRVKNQIDQMLIKVLGESKVVHEEHGDGKLTDGNYVSGIQKQYAPNGWTKVVD